MNVQVGYRTGTGNLLSLNVLGHGIHRDDVPLYEDSRLGWCGKCKGTNGGCAEFAPPFSVLKRSHPYLYVIEIVMDMAWAISRFESKPRKYNYNYFCSGYADSITDKYLAAILKPIMAEKFYALGAGHCKGCRSKKECTVRHGDVCIHPARRTFSIEAVGVDCNELCTLLHGHGLYWYYKKHDYIPVEMRRFAGVFCKDSQDFSTVEGVLLNAVTKHKSYVHDLLPAPVYDEFDVEIPGMSREAGKNYTAYAGLSKNV